ncbi:MAG: NUDIX hydrolase [Bacteroidales bacterium]|jgi:8-oxo-dGTP diphosphatase|nr:NUDIX hydrolase [Bacteroidales bacterium]
MPYIYDYPMPAVTVDIVVFKVSGNSHEVLLIQRLHDPYIDQWALPGGFVEIDEDLEDAAKRELYEETGISCEKLIQLFTVGTPGRDPRYRSISVIYFAWFNTPDVKLKFGDDAKAIKWIHVDSLPRLAFDHNEIIKKAHEIIMKKLV